MSLQQLTYMRMFCIHLELNVCQTVTVLHVSTCEHVHHTSLTMLRNKTQSLNESCIYAL